jgi:beta-glucosidase
VEDLPPLGDYDITNGRTYWFYEGDVLYPFGHGLSYTEFEFGNLQVEQSSSLDFNSKVKVALEVKNTGPAAGDEVVQLYVKNMESERVQPLKKLRAFKRISLKPGESKTIQFDLSGEDFRFWNEEKGGWDLDPGEFEIQIGNSSQNILLKEKIK